MFFVYIIKSVKRGSFYIGYTRNIKKRLQYHNLGLNRSTKNRKPWILVYKEFYNLKKDAIKRERFLKKQRNRDFYKRLISGIGAAG